MKLRRVFKRKRRCSRKTTLSSLNLPLRNQCNFMYLYGEFEVLVEELCAIEGCPENSPAGPLARTYVAR
jgi:hypothetical protein